jgi:RNase P subunit RPR2
MTDLERKAWSEHKRRKRGGINDHFCDNCEKLYNYRDLSEFRRLTNGNIEIFWLCENCQWELI